MNDPKRQPEGPAPLVALGLGKSYEKRRPEDPEFALEGFDLSLGPGEVVVLVGGNGAGKSTALRLMAGVETPSRGRVRIFGESPRAMSSRRRVGYLPDASELFPYLDWRETLDLFAAAIDLPKKEGRARAERWAERLGVVGFGRKRVRTYSLGMRRRLGLAAVLIGGHEVLLLDEPAAGLDPEGQIRLDEVLREERARGAAVVLSSHHLGRVGGVCDRLVALRRGRVALAGGLDEIARRLDARDLTVRGLDEAALSRLGEEARRLGGELLDLRPGEAALAELLLAPEDGPGERERP